MKKQQQQSSTSPSTSQSSSTSSKSTRKESIFSWMKYIIYTVIPIVISYIWIDDWLKVWLTPNRISKAFLQSSEEEKLETPPEKLVKREQLVEDLIELFMDKGEFYNLIVGEQGVGKTTAMKMAIEKARNQKNIPLLYVSHDGKDYNQFYEDFLDSMGVERKRRGSNRLMDWMTTWRSDEPSVGDLLKLLEETLPLIREKIGNSHVRPLLVLDNCNEFEESERGRDFLKYMQKWAKKQADKNNYLVVFISSEGKAPHTLLSRSAMSRMNKYRISEMTDEESKEYLRNTRGIQNEREIKERVQVAGGKPDYLKMKPSQVEEVVLSNIYAAKLNPNTPEMMKVSQEIIENKDGIQREKFEEYFKDRAESLIESKVFSPYGEKVLFQNTATRRFMEKELKNKEIS